MYFHPAELAHHTQGHWLSPPADVCLQALGTDTRKPAPPVPALFVALAGARFDAHALLEQGPMPERYAAVMVSRPCAIALPQLLVADTRRALGQLARAWRARLALPLVALTGSNGKTTVKEMLATILRQRGPTLATQGNLNNDIGVPLTLLSLQAQHQYAVIEMGANHPGEIAYLTQLAQPEVALITNAGPAHLEGFGSIEGVAHAKGEIYGGLGASGVAVIALDDQYAPLWQSLNAQRRWLGFSLRGHPQATVSGQRRGEQQLQLCVDGQTAVLRLSLPGQHNLHNALAAATAAHALGIDLAHIVDGLETVAAVPGRVQIQRRSLDRMHGGALCLEIIDDSYNANPASVKAAIDLLSQQTGTRMLILGDMGELGAQGEALHHEIGVYARSQQVDHLWATGPLSAHTAHGFEQPQAHYASKAALLDALCATLEALLHQPDGPTHISLLIKGSRSQQMEQVVSALLTHHFGSAVHAAHLV